jgi:hypothetical protein
MHRLKVLSLALFLALTGFVDAQGRRYALVIGNSNYQDLGKLANPVNDATDIAASLEKLGFSVNLLKDATRRQINQALGKFHDDLASDGRNEGLFWYAGHGVQAKDENYLIPVGADIKLQADLEDEAVSVGKIMGYLEDARNRVNIVVLDACRNNPLPSLSRALERGLKVVTDTPPESVIMFSTAAGQTAMDGTGRNSPFAQAFLKYLEAPGDISSTIKQITGETKRLTNGIQVPFVYSNLDLDFAFNPSAAASKPASSSSSDVGLSFGNVKPGSLEIKAVSAGTVEINGQKAEIPAGGILPIDNLVPGDYQVKMSYGGGQSETREVRVESGVLAKVSFTYESSAGPSIGAITVKPGNLNIKLRMAGKVEVNDLSAEVPSGGVVPINNLAPGEYKIKVSYGDDQTETRSIRVEAGETYDISFNYDGTTLKLTDLPYGYKASLGGTALDYSQLVAGGAQVEPGTYDLSILSPAGQAWTRKLLTIEEGRRYEFKFGSLNAIVPERTIRMTGGTDEWDGLAPLLKGKDSIDPGLQSLSGPLGSQITKVWMARDKDNLYLRIDLDGEALFNIIGADYVLGFRPPNGTVNDQIDPQLVVGKQGPFTGIYGHQTKTWSPTGSYKPLPSGFELKFPFRALAQSGIKENVEYNLGIWVSLKQTTGVAPQRYIAGGVKVDFE